MQDSSLLSGSLQEYVTRLPSAVPEEFHVKNWSYTGIWTSFSILLTLALSRVLYGKVMYMFCTAAMVAIAVATGSLSESWGASGEEVRLGKVVMVGNAKKYFAGECCVLLALTLFRSNRAKPGRD